VTSWPPPLAGPPVLLAFKSGMARTCGGLPGRDFLAYVEPDGSRTRST